MSESPSDEYERGSATPSEGCRGHALFSAYILKNRTRTRGFLGGYRFSGPRFIPLFEMGPQHLKGSPPLKPAVGGARRFSNAHRGAGVVRDDMCILGRCTFYAEKR